jgi:hypothetical protein
MKKKTSDEGKLFGSVTTKEIEEEFRKLGANVDRRQIVLGKQIKMIGDYSVLVKLVGGMKATIPLKIVPEIPLKSASASLTEQLMADNERLNKRDAANKERDARMAEKTGVVAAAAAAEGEAPASETAAVEEKAPKAAKKKGKKEAK